MTKSGAAALRRRLVLLIALAAAIWAVSAAIASAATVTGSVTRAADGSPIAGATVTASASDQRPVSVTSGADGGFSLEVTGAGPLSLGVQADGFAAQAARDVAAGASVPFVLAPAAFTPLPADVGNFQEIVPDATSGILYGVGTLGPELYRTVDHGGSWQPVTMSYDDPVHGLRSSNLWKFASASAVPGEIAVAVMGVPEISYSTDYGVTWRTVAGDFGAGTISDAPRPFRLFWAHPAAGSPVDVLIAVERRKDVPGWRVWRADMSAAQPTFTAEAADPFGADSVFGFAHTATGAVIGRVDAAGRLAFAPLTARGPIAFGAPEVGGLPTPPQALRLGGAREQSAAPDGALVVGGTGPFTAQVLSKAAGAPGFAGAPSSSATVLPSDCGFTPDPVGGPGGASGSLAPTTAGGTGAGSVGSCWFRMSASAPLLTTRLKVGIGWDGLAFDADWGRGNHVAFGSLDKLTSLDADGIPVVAPFGVVAAGGTGAGSAGAATNGIRGAVVEDTAHGPAGPSQLAVAAGPAFASTDGGATMRRVMGPGFWQAVSSQWWSGTSGDWLVFGYSLSCDHMLSAQRDGSGAAVLSQPNVAGTSCPELGGPAPADCAPCAYMPMSLAAIPGTDSVFIGLGTRYTDATGRRHLYRARLAPGDPPTLADRFSFDDALTGVPLYQPRAMAYCPASAADARMRDVLFVASGVDAAPGVGSLVRITGASTGSPVATQVSSVPHDVARTSLQDVRADCATGVVYAGGSAEHTARSMAQTAGLYRSSDAGLTFARVTLPEPSSELQIEEVTAIGLNPADAQDVTVATTFSGTVLHSTDGGASWTTVNDPAVSRPARVSDIEFTPTPAAAGSALLDARRQSNPRDVFGRPFATAGRDALVGTSNGAFRADLTTGQGVMAITGTTRGVPGAGARITALRSDGDPVVVPAAGKAPALTVFRRADGVYLSEATEGSWWNPTRIPGTRAGDGAPAAVRDRSGRLLVAFARTRGAHGIELVTRSARGAWSKPRRLGALAGDRLPAIAVSGRSIHVIFLRTRGGARGVYDAAFVNRRWRRAARIPGTTGADAQATLGGPAAQGAGGTAHLAFARAGSAPGVLYAAARGSRWGALRRLTTVPGDARPALAVGARRVHIVFRRPGRGGGLVALSGGGTRWVTRPVPGSTLADTDPAVSLSGRDLFLAFARRRGARPGIHVSRATASGRWVGRPRRWSRSASDAHPAIGSAAGVHLSVVFERG